MQFCNESAAFHENRTAHVLPSGTERSAEGKNVVKLDTSAGDLLDTAKNFNSEVVCSIDLYGLAALAEIGGKDTPHTLADGNAQEEVKFMTATENYEIWDTPYVHTPANPYWYLDDQDAEKITILFLHGTGDNRVPPYSTEKFFGLTTEKGIPSYRFLIPGAAHGSPRFMQDDTSTLFMDFFDENLQGYTGNRVTILPNEGGAFEVKLNNLISPLSGEQPKTRCSPEGGFDLKEA